MSARIRVFLKIRRRARFNFTATATTYKVLVKPSAFTSLLRRHYVWAISVSFVLPSSPATTGNVFSLGFPSFGTYRTCGEK